MIDSKPYKALKQHLATKGMTPEEYRERYRLKADYMMVAPSYAASRSAMAKSIGFGRKRKQADDVQAPSPAASAPDRGKRSAKAVSPK